MTELTTDHLLYFAIVAMILYYFTSRCGSGFRVGAPILGRRRDGKIGVGPGGAICGCNLVENCGAGLTPDKFSCDLSNCRDCQTEDLPCSLDQCDPNDYLAENNNDPYVAHSRSTLNSLYLNSRALLYPTVYGDRSGTE